MHKATTSDAGIPYGPVCDLADPLPILVPAKVPRKAAEFGPNSCAPAPIWETWNIS